MRRPCKGLRGFVASAFRRLQGRDARGRGAPPDPRNADASAPRPSTDAAIDALVEAYVENHLVDLPLVPNFIERRIYRGVLKMGLDALTGGEEGGEGGEGGGCVGSCVVMGHRIRAHLDPSAVVDAVREHRTQKTAEEVAAQRRLIDLMIARFSRHRVLDVRFVPDAVQETMYANVIEMVVGLLQDTLECARAVILGHELSFQFVPTGGGGADPPVAPESREVTEAREGVVCRMVQAYMEENNRFFIPDGIERALYKAGLNVFLCVVSDLLRGSHLRLMNHRVTLTITPLPPPAAAAPEAPGTAA